MATALALAFLALAVRIERSDHLPGDRRVLHELHRVLGTDADRAMVLVGQATDLVPLVALSVAVIVHLLLRNQRVNALRVATIVGAVIVVNRLVKEVIARPRPSIREIPEPVSTWSFPSGHASSTAALLGALLIIAPAARRRTLLATGGVVVLLLVGFSRLAIGAHYPSDVLGGWLWVAALVIFTTTLRHRPGGPPGRIRGPWPLPHRFRDGHDGGVKTGHHDAHDRLLNRVRLTERRLGRLSAEVAADETLAESELSARVDGLTDRCTELADRLRSWTEVEVGVLTAVEDLGGAVDAFEADLSAARADEPAGYEEAVDRQVRTWRTRIDRLRLHGHLATMEAHDELEALTQRLEGVRATALDGLHDTAEDARTTVTDLRSDVEKVLADVRKVIEDAAAGLIRR